MNDKEQMAYEMDMERTTEPEQETAGTDGAKGRSESWESRADAAEGRSESWESQADAAEGRIESGKSRSDRAEDRIESGESRTDAVEDGKDGRKSTQRVGKKERKRGYKLTGSFGAKMVAAFLMFFSAAVCAAGAVACYAAWETDMYTASFTSALENVLSGHANGIAYKMYNYLNNGYEDSARLYLDERNAEVAVIRAGEGLASDSSVFLWQSYEPGEAMADNGLYSPLYVDEVMPIPIFDEPGVEEQWYVVRVFFDPKFPLEDDIRLMVRLAEALYEFRYAAIAICVNGGVLFILCLIFLLCGAGHKNGREGIVPGILTGIPFDVLTLVFFLVEMTLIGLMGDVLWDVVPGIVCYVVFGVVNMILGISYLWDLVIRLKLGRLWKHTLIFMVLRGLWRGLRILGRLFLGIPTVWLTAVSYIMVCILDAAMYFYPDFWILWLLEKIALFAAVLYIALTCKKLLRASGELAEGHEGYRVDTKSMFGDFREHGENLNSLGQGMSKAVAERLKSERLKTELITNVSHDLKTPLTSIINYAELINHEATENPRITEYSEVLLRQSGRLKRLLENLVEASKATTGNLEVQLAPCEAGVLLTQAVGEYQQRMEEKALELRVNQPEEPVRILADGRHLWRVFDNLLSNICKYAQENTRVYLTLEQKADSVFIIFRNMSKYALNITPEELEERFVRGDRSRHMEGNGLGLSIAKSLTELQKGEMDIVVDGDLFKVTLIFRALQEH